MVEGGEMEMMKEVCGVEGAPRADGGAEEVVGRGAAERMRTCVPWSQRSPPKYIVPAGSAWDGSAAVASEGRSGCASR